MSRKRRPTRRAERKAEPKAVREPGPETPVAPPESPRRWLLAMGLIALAGFGVYANALRGPFVFDDIYSIVDNPNLRNLSPLASALEAPPGTGANGRPLVALSLAFNYALGGLDVFGYHLFNVIVHVATALALFGLLRLTLRSWFTKDTGERAGPSPTVTACAVALLWVVHPLHTDALNHVVYRNEALMGLFFLLTLYLSARGFGAHDSGAHDSGARDSGVRDSGARDSGTRASGLRGRLGWFAAASLTCALGVACKEPMAAAPILVWALDRCFYSGSWGQALRRHAGLYAGLALSWLLLFAIVSGADRGTTVGSASTGVSPWQYLMTQSEVLLHYLGLAAFPEPLVFDYDDWPIASGLAEVWLPVLAVLALLLATGFALWRFPAVGLCGLLFFAVLAPSSSFIPLTGEIVGEHRMYLPLAGLVALAVVGTTRWLYGFQAEAEHRSLPAVSLILVVSVTAALGFSTVERNRDYQSALALWSDTAAKRPRNARAFEHTGRELARAQEYERAIQAYETSLELKVDNANAHFELANLLAFMKRPEEAREHMALALEHDPKMPEKLFAYALGLLQIGRTTEAITKLHGVVELDPGYRPAVRRLARILATAPAALHRNGAEALRLAESLMRSSALPTANDLDTLGAAYAELGRFDEARDAARRAASMAEAAGNHRRALAIGARLAAYEAGRAWREDPR